MSNQSLETRVLTGFLLAKADYYLPNAEAEKLLCARSSRCAWL
jgi:hypothetical protein